MKIPEIQTRLLKLSDDLSLGDRHPLAMAMELRDLAKELSRRPGTRGRTVSPPMTAELCAAIHKIHQANPELNQAEIARKVGVNAGRVSETLRGFRA